MFAQLVDAVQTVAITMLVGFLMGLASLIRRLWRGEDF